MTPLWHPVSALLLTDPVMLATRRILKMLLVAGGATEVTYAGDRMHPAVRHGDRVRVEPIGDRPPEAGEVVVAAEGSELDPAAAAEALQSLPEKHREVIVARLWGGLSFEQIAEALDLSTSSAHRRYQAGLQQLRERLDVSWTPRNNSTT